MARPIIFLVGSLAVAQAFFVPKPVSNLKTVSKPTSFTPVTG
jgi:hypothetical protein